MLLREGCVWPSCSVVSDDSPWTCSMLLLAHESVADIGVAPGWVLLPLLPRNFLYIYILLRKTHDWASGDIS